MNAPLTIGLGPRGDNDRRGFGNIVDMREATVNINGAFVMSPDPRLVNRLTDPERYQGGSYRERSDRRPDDRRNSNFSGSESGLSRSGSGEVASVRPLRAWRHQASGKNDGGKQTRQLHRAGDAAVHLQPKRGGQGEHQARNRQGNCGHCRLRDGGAEPERHKRNGQNAHPAVLSSTLGDRGRSSPSSSVVGSSASRRQVFPASPTRSVTSVATNESWPKSSLGSTQGDSVADTEHARHVRRSASVLGAEAGYVSSSTRRAHTNPFDGATGANNMYMGPKSAVKPLQRGRQNHVSSVHTGSRPPPERPTNGSAKVPITIINEMTESQARSRKLSDQVRRPTKTEAVRHPPVNVRGLMRPVPT